MTPNTGANSFNSRGWTTGSSIDAADYLQVQFNVADDVQASLSSIDGSFRRSTTGPTSFQWGYSLNSDPITMIGSPFSFLIDAGSGDPVSQNLSTVTGLQNIAGGTLVTFRLFGYDAGGATGTFSFQSAGLGANDLAINGVVTPEPSTLVIYSLFGATTLAGAAWRRRPAKKASA